MFLKSRGVLLKRNKKGEKKIKINQETIDILGDELNFEQTNYNKERVKILGKMIKLIRNYK